MFSRKWSCPSCGSKNDGAVVACGRCGRGRDAPPSIPYQDRFERGAEDASAPDVQPRSAGPDAPAPQALATPAGPSFLARLAGRFWPLAIVAAIGVGGAIFAAQRDDSGQIVEGGDLSAFDLRVGDCYDLKDADAEEIGDVEAKPCSERHEFEVIHVGELTASEFPDEDALWDEIAAICLPAFDAYIGKAYEESELDIFPMTPTEEGWREGDRAIVCSAYHPLQDELTSSVKDSER